MNLKKIKAKSEKLQKEQNQLSKQLTKLEKKKKRETSIIPSIFLAEQGAQPF